MMVLSNIQAGHDQNIRADVAAYVRNDIILTDALLELSLTNSYDIKVEVLQLIQSFAFANPIQDLDDLIQKKGKIFNALNNVIQIENIGLTNPKFLEVYLKTCMVLFIQLSFDQNTGENNDKVITTLPTELQDLFGHYEGFTILEEIQEKCKNTKIIEKA